MKTEPRMRHPKDKDGAYGGDKRDYNAKQQES
jgi:hypothetical protein